MITQRVGVRLLGMETTSRCPTKDRHRVYRPRLRLPKLMGLGIVSLALAAAVQPAAIAGAEPAALSTDQPGLFLSGVQQPDMTRYSVTVNNQTQTTLLDLQVSVALPSDAVFDHALETPGFTQFLGPDNQTLNWKAASFAPDDVVDAFTFFLAQPASGAFTVNASWDGDGAGQVQQEIQPTIRTATDTAADLTLDPSALARGPISIGNTGVVIDAVSGTIPAGTSLSVSVLGADSNPSTAVGDLWWCSMVQIDGLPSGAGLLIEVPTRQPLPPAADVQLFGLDGQQWNTVQDQAQVSADGQSILYVHHGGLVASGTSFNNQPVLAGAVVSAPISANPAVRQILVNKIVQSVAFQQLAQLMVQPAQCPPANCAPYISATGPTVCLNSNLVAGNRCVNASLRSQNDKVQNIAGTSIPLIGTTTCNSGGSNCTGYVGLLAVGQPAAPGHGTMCTFMGFTQAVPPGLTCSQF